MTYVHQFALRVYFEDTDFTGLVYHANYLRFIERARTEMLRACGVSQSALLQEEQGLFFVVARLSIDFIRPARMDDALIVETEPLSFGAASLQLRQRVLREGVRLAEAIVTVASVRDGRPRRLPDSLRTKLENGPVSTL